MKQPSKVVSGVGIASRAILVKNSRGHKKSALVWHMKYTIRMVYSSNVLSNRPKHNNINGSTPIVKARLGL